MDDVRDRVDGFVFLLYQVQWWKMGRMQSERCTDARFVSGAVDVSDLQHQLYPEHDLVPRNC